MTRRPYLVAWDAYHRYGVPAWSWNESMTAHLHHGMVIATDKVFCMARRVMADDPDEIHLSPLQWRENGDCWNIWLAAGRLDVFLRLTGILEVPWVSFCRRASVRVRRYRIHELRHHGLSIRTQTPAPSAAGSNERA